MSLKRISLLLTLLLIFTLALVACGGGGEEQTAEEGGVKVCQVTDAGGIDDKSFNATAWKGAQQVEAELGGEAKYLESQQQTDYERNINAFLEDDCDLIVTVGFLLGDATAAAAETNPEQNFAIVDFAYDPAFDNVLGLVFATDEAAFMAGYLAAGTTQTGKVGTFGGINIPTVSIFMDGFALGVDHYNEVHGTNVEVLGWDPATQDGLFVGNFESTDDGKTLGETLISEGADIIMPVAGPVGLGTAAAAQEAGNVYIIGVDSDWTLTAPDYANIILTSVLKKMDVSVLEASRLVMNDEFSGGIFLGTLENEGVDITEFGQLDSMVSSDLKTELEGVRAAIIAGELQTAP